MLNKSKNFLIVLAGPTAVGKTKLSVDIAKKYGSHIFSADSRQIYKEMDIGTAKPTPKETQDIKHHFIDYVSIEEAYSAGDYMRDFDSLISDYYQSHNIAILTGGTGLYIKTILKGINFFPPTDTSAVKYYEELLVNEGIEKLQIELKRLDPEYYQSVDLKNSSRLIRALALIKSAPHNFSYYRNQDIERNLPFIPIKILLLRDRAELYERINQRVDDMMEQGLLEEARKLYPYRNYRSLNTVGYTELFNYINGEIQLDEAVRLIKRNTRRYAKRQMTWFRNQDDFEIFHSDEISKIVHFIDQQVSAVDNL